MERPEASDRLATGGRRTAAFGARPRASAAGGAAALLHLYLATGVMRSRSNLKITGKKGWRNGTWQAPTPPIAHLSSNAIQGPGRRRDRVLRERARRARCAKSINSRKTRQPLSGGGETVILDRDLPVPFADDAFAIAARPRSYLLRTGRTFRVLRNPYRVKARLQRVVKKKRAVKAVAGLQQLF